MRENETVRAFEELSLPPSEFRHHQHLLVAWSYLRDLPFGEAGARFARNLRRFASAHGAEGKYHETITWAYLALLNERLHASALARSPEASFAEFLAQNPDLIDRDRGALATIYDRETLASPLAREAFVLPRPRLAAGLHRLAHDAVAHDAGKQR
jgi:hypothetical protein